MPSVMPYLIINYPNPDKFWESLEAALAYSPDYLEIQWPFSNPMADGPVVWEADQEALKYPEALEETLGKIATLKIKYPDCRTELVLMSYVTRVFQFGISEFADLLAKHDFYGLVCPDLNSDSPEYKELNTLWQNKKPSIIPVISPLTSKARLDKIKATLKDGQMIYPMARVGITGKDTNLESVEVKTYFEFLNNELKGFKVAIGFGIKTYEQVKVLDENGFTAIVATEIIQRIKQANDNNQDIGKVVTQVLKELHGE